MAKPDKTLHILTPEQENAIDTLLTGATDQATAQAVGVTRQTVWIWRNENPEFIAELNRRRAAVWAGQTERLRALATKALGVLESDLENADDPRLRQAAAVHILRAAGRYGVVDQATDAPLYPAEIRRGNLLKDWAF